MPGATTRVVPASSKSITSVSEYFPLTNRDAAWDALPLAEERTLVLASAKRNLEESLDRWGITPASHWSPAAVGLTVAALSVPHPEFPDGTVSLIWADKPRYLLLTFENRVLANAQMIREPREADFATGPDAKSLQAQFPKTQIVRPAGLSPSFAVAWGASQWGTPTAPYLPRLEPQDRVEFRQRHRTERRTRRFMHAAAASFLLLSAAIYASAAWSRANADHDRDRVLSQKAEADAILSRIAPNLERIALPSTDQSMAVTHILGSVVRHKDVIRLTELRGSSAVTNYPGLQSAEQLTIMLSGRAKNMAALETLTAELSVDGRKAVLDESRAGERLDLPVEFRITVQ